MFLNSVNSEEDEIGRHVINVGHLSCSDVICVEFSSFVCLFIYLSNDVVTGSDCTASNGMIVSEYCT